MVIRLTRFKGWAVRFGEEGRTGCPRSSVQPGSVASLMCRAPGWGSLPVEEAL
jgi:hypothetical protein